MEITQITLTPVQDHSRVRAFARLVFDDAFLVDDIRLIEIDNHYLVSMPSEKATFRCPRCHFKNPFDAIFCSQCGYRVDNLERVDRFCQDGREFVRHHRLVFTIDPSIKRKINDAVIGEYRAQMESVRQ